MSEHTKGPWVQDKWGKILGQNGRDVLFRGLSLLSSGSDERIQEAEANTQLACAAPELLEALQICVSQIRALCSADDVPDQAIAAIAKASKSTSVKTTPHSDC